MKSPRILSLVMVFVVCLAGSAQAQWGWKMPNLNPFKRRDSHPASLGGQGSSGWTWPTIGKKSSQASGPSMWQRMSSGTKGAWTKTKDTLYPWGKEEPKSVVITGSNSTFNELANGKKEPTAKKAFWSWGADDEDEQSRNPRSASDFIGGRRPE